MKKLVKNVKYRFATQIFEELFRVIKPSALFKLSEYRLLSPIITPIPLHKDRLRERGFNQAELLARYFSHATTFPLQHILERQKYTQAQAQLTDIRARYDNLHNAFALLTDTPVKNKTIILVDDVLTSGATTKEAGYILKKNNAAKVFVLTLVRG